MRDLRLVVDVVDAELDAVLDAAGLDDGHTHRLGVGLIELVCDDVAHREDGLQRVALGAAGRRHVGLARTDADHVIEN